MCSHIIDWLILIFTEKMWNEIVQNGLCKGVFKPIGLHMRHHNEFILVVLFPKKLKRHLHFLSFLNVKMTL